MNKKMQLIHITSHQTLAAYCCLRQSERSVAHLLADGHWVEIRAYYNGARLKTLCDVADNLRDMCKDSGILNPFKNKRSVEHHIDSLIYGAFACKANSFLY